MEVDNTATASTSKSELTQFLEDFWIELRKYDPIIALLTAWGVFPPPPGFQAKKYFRLLLFCIQSFLAIGLTVQLSCTRDPMPEGVVIILTLLLVTIPIEILNLVWFRIVKSDEEVQNQNKDSGCCASCCRWTVQYLGKGLGGLAGLFIFAYGTVFFVLAFAGIHPGCSERHRYALVTNIIVFQFLLVPFCMSLPYWREQSVILSLLGELGPVIGLFMHVCKYGFHPPKRTAGTNGSGGVGKDVENPLGGNKDDSHLTM